MTEHCISMGEVTGLRVPATRSPVTIPKATEIGASACTPLETLEELQKHKTEIQSFIRYIMQSSRLNIHFILSLHFGIQVSPH